MKTSAYSKVEKRFRIYYFFQLRVLRIVISGSHALNLHFRSRSSFSSVLVSTHDKRSSVVTGCTAKGEKSLCDGPSTAPFRPLIRAFGRHQRLHAQLKSHPLCPAGAHEIIPTLIPSSHERTTPPTRLIGIPNTRIPGMS